MSDFFDAPPEGATGQAGKDFDRHKTVNYKSGKTPAQYVQHATASLHDDVAAGRVGFYIYDRETKSAQPFKEFSFVVLAAYATINGSNGDTRYWATRSADTRTQPIKVYSSGSFEWRGDKKLYKPILEGLYNKDFTKDNLPSGAHYTIVLVAYCLNTKEVVEIETTNAVRSGMENALLEAKQKNTFLLSLTSGDYLWGFSLTGYAQSAKDGKPYAGIGEMFWQPVFRCGTLNPANPAQKDLHALASAFQYAEREKHEYFLQRSGAKVATPEPTEYAQPQPSEIPPAQPAQTNVRPSEAANTVHVPANVQTPVGRKEPEPVNILDDDTLPF